MQPSLKKSSQIISESSQLDTQNLRVHVVSSQENTHRAISKRALLSTLSWYLSQSLELTSCNIPLPDLCVSHIVFRVTNIISNPPLNTASFSPIFIPHSFSQYFFHILFEGLLGALGAEDKVINNSKNVKTLISTNSRCAK